MQTFEKQFDNLWVNGYNLGTMKNLSLQQLLEAKDFLHEEHTAEIAAIDRLIARKQRDQGNVPINEDQSEKPLILARTVKEATAIAVSHTKGKFSPDEIVTSVRKLYTKKPVVASAVSTALSLLRKAGKIRTIKEKKGATPGIYIKA